MLFWTIIFLCISIIGLIKGSLFYNTNIKTGELTIKLSQATNEKEKEELKKEVFKAGWGVLLFGIMFIIARIIYLLSAIHYDFLKYPTLVIIAIMAIVFIKQIVTPNNTKDSNLNTEETINKYRAKIYQKRTVSGFLMNLINLSYFGYMLWILVLK